MGSGFAGFKAYPGYHKIWHRNKRNPVVLVSQETCWEKRTHFMLKTHAQTSDATLKFQQTRNSSLVFQGVWVGSWLEAFAWKMQYQQQSVTQTVERFSLLTAIIEQYPRQYSVRSSTHFHTVIWMIYFEMIQSASLCESRMRSLHFKNTERHQLAVPTISLEKPSGTVNQSTSGC